MLIFGGFIHGARSNNVFRFRLDTHAWDIPRISGTPPAERSGHSAIVYNNAMYIFAGISESTDSLNDLWKLDLDTMI